MSDGTGITYEYNLWCDDSPDKPFEKNVSKQMSVWWLAKGEHAGLEGKPSIINRHMVEVVRVHRQVLRTSRKVSNV